MRFQPNGNVLVLGTEGDDTIVITPVSAAEVRIALNGEEIGPFDLSGDRIINVRASLGDDIIDANAVSNMVGLRINAGAGNDVVIAGRGRDTLDGGKGDDSLLGGGGADTLTGGEGDDTLGGGDGSDLVLGGEGDDDLDGNNLNDVVDGGEGDDLISGGRGNDFLVGGPGLDTLVGRGGQDTLEGGGGDDALNGGGGDDCLLGGMGDDVLEGQGGADTALGGLGDDSLDGGSGGDSLGGGSGRDTLRGGQQTDSLFGGEGVDLFVVGAVPGSGPFSDEHELRMANGFLQHRQFRNGALIDQDRIFGFDNLEDEVLLEALGGDDTIRVASDVMIGGTLNGGDGFDLAILDPTIRANWILANIEDEEESDEG